MSFIGVPNGYRLVSAHQLALENVTTTIADILATQDLHDPRRIACFQELLVLYHTFLSNLLLLGIHDPNYMYDPIMKLHCVNVQAKKITDNYQVLRHNSVSANSNDAFNLDESGANSQVAEVLVSISHDSFPTTPVAVIEYEKH